MNRMPLQLLGCVLAALSVIADSSGARAEYPDRPIRVLVPFQAGGTIDIVARVVTARMADELKATFVIENRAGAGGVIATEATAKALPDGYTLLFTSPNHTINAALKAKLPFDTEKDLAPVAMAAEIPELLVSSASAPFKDFAGFVAYAKANPGKLNYASAGNGTLPHVTMEMLLRGLKLNVAHVPYRGAASAMTDLLAGQVQVKLDTYATSSQYVANGQLHALAFAGSDRLPTLSNVPTVAETLPGYEGVLWMGFLAPAGTPQPIVDKLAAAVKQAVTSAETVERLKRDGVEPVDIGPKEFGARITREIAQWRELAKVADIKVD